MKKIIIYPGRFQPMLRHHAQVVQQLEAQFPDAEVYVGTSDKVEEPKSPFNFEEKRMIAQAHGINPDRVLQAKSPYNKDAYPFDQDNTMIIFAVGEKDMDRFPFNNVDPDSGLDMTVRGEPKPKYYQKLETAEQGVLPMSQRGYITLAPTVRVGNQVASASAFRQSLKDAPDKEAAKKLYTQQFGEYNEKVFNLIYDKIVGTNMSEQINILRQLAGLPVSEAAPVNFSGEEPKTSTENLILAKAGRILMDMAVGISDDELSNHISQLGGKFADGDLTDSADVMQAVRATGEHAKQVAQMLGDAFAQARSGKDVTKGEDPVEEAEIDRVDLSDFYEEEESFVDGELRVLFRQYSDALGEMGGYGDPDIAKCNELAKAGNVQACADHFFDSFSDQDGGELNVDDMYHDFIADIAHVVGVQEAAKPDFLDLDKDGDTEESMKDAAEDAEEKDEEVEEAVENTTANAMSQAMNELRKLAGL